MLFLLDEGRNAIAEIDYLYTVSNIQSVMLADIQQQIISDFSVESERSEAFQLVSSLNDTLLNVGPSQLSRACLVICNGNLISLKKLFDSGFMGDPRDVIVEAERVLGNPGHYCINPFPYK